MSLLSAIKLKILYQCLIILFFFSSAYGYVYVYEVTTSKTRFQTASKLSPATFWLINGGKDTIKDLKIVKVFSDRDFNKALKEFKLEEDNNNTLLPKNVPNRPDNSPFIWWR